MVIIFKGNRKIHCCCCSVARLCLLFVTPQTATHQSPLYFTVSWNLFKFMSIELVMLSNHLILCHPLFPFAFSHSHNQGLFQWVSSLPQVASFGALESVLPMNIWDWFPLGLTSLIALQFKGLSRVFSNSSKASVLQLSAFSVVQLSHPSTVILEPKKVKSMDFLNVTF